MAYASLDGDVPETTVLLLGDPGIGKSAFLSRLTLSPSHVQPTSSHPLPYLRDLDQPFPFNVTISSRPHLLSFYDTSSPTNYTLLTPSLIVLCYDIAQPQTLNSVRTRWYDLVHRTYMPNTPGDALPVLLMGLKRDKRGRSGERTREEMKGLVHPMEGMKMAQGMRCERYMECSAETGELVRECMQDIARVAVSKQKGEEVGEGGGCSIM